MKLIVFVVLFVSHRRYLKLSRIFGKQYRVIRNSSSNCGQCSITPKGQRHHVPGDCRIVPVEYQSNVVSLSKVKPIRGISDSVRLSIYRGWTNHTCNTWIDVPLITFDLCRHGFPLLTEGDSFYGCLRLDGLLDLIYSTSSNGIDFSNGLWSERKSSL